MVSFTVLVVSVWLVIEPWVKFGITGTALTGTSMALAPTTAVTDNDVIFPKFMISYAPHYLMVSSDTNCPVADVPAPPAVIVDTPALVIVPANVPATPPDVVVVEPSNGNAATTPDDTEDVEVTSSPSMNVSLRENADPTVFNSSADGV